MKSKKNNDKDKLFNTKREKVEDFNFGKETAEVFDNMLERSIPLYYEQQEMIGEITGEFAQEGTNVYDLGCSTGITLSTITKKINKKVNIVGIDYSTDMLKKCKEKLHGSEYEKNLKLICADLNQAILIHNASVVVLNLTLQFVRPLNRENLIKCIYEGLVDKGCLILVEKILGNNSIFNRVFIKLYYDMKKRQGYTEMEIAQKREALENVLIPYRLNENIELLKRNGFKHLDVFFKWYNFCGILAIKQT